MENIRPPEPTHIPSVLQLILSCLGLLVLGAGIVLFLLAGISSRLYQPDQTLMAYSFMWLAVAGSAMLIPSAVYALARLSGHPLPSVRVSHSLTLSAIGMIIWFGLLAFGGQIAGSNINALLLALLGLPGVGLPLLFIFSLSSRGLTTGNSQRTWGLTSISLLLTPFITILTELILLAGLVLISVVVLSLRYPQEMQQVSAMINSASNGLNSTALTQFQQNVLSQPGFIAIVLMAVAVMVPMVEELFKPLALWFIAGKWETPAQGFVAGLICGGLFALVESMGTIGSVSAPDWAVTLLERGGTSLLHMTTCAAVGWALASAWSQGRYLRLTTVYLGAVLLHGTWNAFAIMLGFSPLLARDLAIRVPAAVWMGQAAPLVLGLLTFGMLVFLILMNQRLVMQTAIAVTPL